MVKPSRGTGGEGALGSNTAQGAGSTEHKQLPWWQALTGRRALHKWGCQSWCASCACRVGEAGTTRYGRGVGGQRRERKEAGHVCDRGSTPSSIPQKARLKRH